jgi:hypothetical protein
MSQLMRNDAGGEAERVADLMQVITELTNERFFGAGAGQESSIGRQRVEGTKESEALDEFTYKRIHRDHTFGFELAEGHMNRPLLGAME